MARQPTNDAAIDTFWAAVDDGRLSVQRCTSCGTLRFPPGPVCPSCAGDDSEWHDVSGDANVLSWTTTHHRFHAAFADRLPYTVVLVELIEQSGLAMYGTTPTAEGLVEGLRVRADFVAGAAGEQIVRWQPMPVDDEDRRSRS